MGIYATDLRELVIRPVLQQLDQWSPTTEDLLLGTAAHESQLGFRMHSPNDTGLGIYRISPNSHLQLWDTFLVKDPDIASRVRGFASQQQFLRSPDNELVTNLSYATAIAWMIYKSNLVHIPHNSDPLILAQCWFNSFKPQHEKANFRDELDKFVVNYHKLVLRESKNMAA